MSISRKTQKILWTKAGNKCALCNQKLITEIGNNHTILGEECHIVSQQKNGPRHRDLIDYDSLENLILLCRVHHKLIDDNPEIFTEKILLNIKKSHNLRINKIENDKNGVCLTLLTHTKDLIRTLEGSYMIATDYPAERKEDYQLFREFFEWVNNFDILEDTDEFYKIEKFNPYIEELQKKGYIILLGNAPSYDKYKMETAFVIIQTMDYFLKKQGE